MRKIISLVLSAALILSLAGCGSKTADRPNKGTNAAGSGQQPGKQDMGSGNAVDMANAASASTGFLQKLSMSYAAEPLAENYAAPIYNVPKDHVFEFECGSEISSRPWDAFRVLLDPEEGIDGFSFSSVDTSNGKIYVKPALGVALKEDGSTMTDSWGDLNKLYLVQFQDLMTGEKLDKPIVTPFTVQNELDAPIVTQGVTEGNLYKLSWKAVPGAASYRVYEKFAESNEPHYLLECETADTEVTVDEFASQKEDVMYDDLVKQDLKNMGYQNAVEEGRYTHMNTCLRYQDDRGSRFVVVAVGSKGQSGISNEVDVRDIANMLPYKIANNKLEVEITTPMDAPSYIGVEMIDGSISNMLINYHGSHTWKNTENPNEITLMPYIYNSLFQPFVLKMTGVPYDDVIAQAQQFASRQDEMNKSGGLETGQVALPQAPSSQETQADETAQQKIEEAKSEASEQMPASEQEQPKETEQPEKPEQTEPQSGGQTGSIPDGVDQSKMMTLPDGNGTTYDAFLECAAVVQQRLSQIEGLDDVFYAESKLGAWIGYSLVAQMEYIPVPVCVFPEAANQEYLGEVLMEAYRQNPTSGMIKDVGFSFPYETLVISYREDMNTRANKMVKELAAAKRIAGQVASSGSDLDKIYAINDYLCQNAEYDFDSMSTNVDPSAQITEKYADAHTPYGILCSNLGVCESYAEAFALIARYAGLDAVMEVGTLTGGPHEWNRVKADGQWYIVDVTNNDNEFAPNYLLNVTEGQSAAMLTPDGSAYRNTRSATDESKEYYAVKGMYASSVGQASDMLASQLKSGDKVMVRLPVGTSEEDAMEAAKQAVQKAGTAGKYAGAGYAGWVLFFVEE